MGKCADNNESSKHKMSDNDKSNEKRSKMDRRIKTLKERQKKKSWKLAHRPGSTLLNMNHELYLCNFISYT